MGEIRELLNRVGTQKNMYILGFVGTILLAIGLSFLWNAYRNGWYHGRDEDASYEFISFCKNSPLFFLPSGIICLLIAFLFSFFN